MAERVEQWFNRRYGRGRRDVYLLRTDTGWQVVGRLGGPDGQQVTLYFDREDQARIVLQRMLDSTPAPVRQLGRDDPDAEEALGRSPYVVGAAGTVSLGSALSVPVRPG